VLEPGSEKASSGPQKSGQTGRWFFAFGARASAIADSAAGHRNPAYGTGRPHYLSGVYLARVVGRVVATVKQDTLSGITLQWLQPITAKGASIGKPLVAVDRVGVGPGEVVYYITSREAALTLDKPFAAVDAGIVGKVDFVDLGTERLLGERE
jgi:ethanolamine utilization protein EutN